MIDPGYLTIEMIRREVQDRIPADNTIDCDLFFTDEDITYAMGRAAAAYNDLPPRGVDIVNASYLPSDTNIFLNCVLNRLYTSASHKLARNVVTWQSGGTTVDLEKTRLELFRVLAKETEAAWKEAAMSRKGDINRDLAWNCL